MTSVAIILGSASDKYHTENGLKILRDLGIPFELRIGSAYRTPAHVKSLIADFEQKGVAAFVCCAGPWDHLAGVVAAHTLKPVVAVPITTCSQTSLGAPLNLNPMPPGIPVATMHADDLGFQNAVVFAAQIIAGSNAEIAGRLADHRQQKFNEVMTSDEQESIRFDG